MVVDVTRAYGSQRNASSAVPMLSPPLRRGFAGLSDPIVSIGAAGQSSYNSGTNASQPCPDCPTDCSSVDEVVTMYVSPQQQSPDDKQIPVVRTGRVCSDTELDIDCDNSTVQPTMNGLGNVLGNATDGSDAILVTDPPQEASSTNTLLLVGVVAAIATLATVALTSGTTRRR